MDDVSQFGHWLRGQFELGGIAFGAALAYLIQLGNDRRQHSRHRERRHAETQREVLVNATVSLEKLAGDFSRLGRYRSLPTVAYTRATLFYRDPERIGGKAQDTLAEFAAAIAGVEEVGPRGDCQRVIEAARAILDDRTKGERSVNELLDMKAVCLDSLGDALRRTW